MSGNENEKKKGGWIGLPPNIQKQLDQLANEPKPNYDDDICMFCAKEKSCNMCKAFEAQRNGKIKSLSEMPGWVENPPIC